MFFYCRQSGLDFLQHFFNEKCKDANSNSQAIQSEGNHKLLKPQWGFNFLKQLQEFKLSNYPSIECIKLTTGFFTWSDTKIHFIWHGFQNCTYQSGGIICWHKYTCSGCIWFQRSPHLIFAQFWILCQPNQCSSL